MQWTNNCEIQDRVFVIWTTSWRLKTDSKRHAKCINFISWRRKTVLEAGIPTNLAWREEHNKRIETSHLSEDFHYRIKWKVLRSVTIETWLLISTYKLWHCAETNTEHDKAAIQRARIAKNIQRYISKTRDAWFHRESEGHTLRIRPGSLHSTSPCETGLLNNPYQNCIWL